MPCPDGPRQRGQNFAPGPDTSIMRTSEGAVETATAQAATRRMATAARATRCFTYWPGTMMCAVDVPAFMIQAPPCRGLSGRPVDAVVAPGTAIVEWWRVARSR